jgi:hypothetical protein
MLKKLFCKHDYVSLGKYYKTFEGEWVNATPITYVKVCEAFKCKKCQKIKHKKLFVRKFVGWNANRDYQRFLRSEDVPNWDEWLLRL